VFQALMFWKQTSTGSEWSKVVDAGVGIPQRARKEGAAVVCGSERLDTLEIQVRDRDIEIGTNY
jgi:hypothetical protein